MQGPFRDRVASRRYPGFSLIITISMLVLITLVAVGLLSLSSITLRISGAGRDMNEARANARMALGLAIGDLQKHAGADTRVTARADILDEDHSPVVGVWRSWEGSDHERSGRSAGRPVSPGDYRSSKEDRLLAWLVSGGDPEDVVPPDTRPGAARVPLVGVGSVGRGDDRDELEVHVEPTSIVAAQGEATGGFAWWVGGENQKAHLPRPQRPEADTTGRWASHLKSHSVSDPAPFGMDALLDDPAPAARAITLGQTDLLGATGERPTSREHFHDLSPHSVGLLTNTATGGWRKDLSLLTENWSKAGTSGLPLFQLEPGRSTRCNLPTSGQPLASRSMLYPWAEYRSGDIPIYQHGPVASWENLRDYVMAYRGMGMQIAAGGEASMRPRSVSIQGNSFRFLHRVRVHPVVARVQWVFSHYALPSIRSFPRPPPGSLRPLLLVTPVVTIWNPYNVEIEFGSGNLPLSLNFQRPIPVALRYTVGGETTGNFSALNSGGTNNVPPMGRPFSYRIRDAFRLMPGETRVFSPVETQPEGAVLELQPGYRTGGGNYFPIVTPSSRGRPANGVDPGVTMKADARFNSAYDDFGTGVGVYLDLSSGGIWSLAYRMVYTEQVASAVYPELTRLATSPPLGTLQNNPSPFLTTVFGARMASKTHLAAKGFVQSSPFVNYTAMGVKDRRERSIGRDYLGTEHPVNSPFDFSFAAVSRNDSLLPNADESTNRGYIVTGFTVADGLSRCVISELPTRPVQSLGELQNWDLRYENPIPPFAFNLVGNSDATPLLPADAVVNARDAGYPQNLQHDDSYCINHLLFDDWFFSSIAPDPDSFGADGRDLQTTFREFVEGEAPLPNRAYRPIAGDLAAASGSKGRADELFAAEVNRRDSWRTIASRLEVEGMFNVNSTSVTAWRALLGHARNQRVPHVKDSGSAWSVELSDEGDYGFSRTSVAGDVEARGIGTSGDFPDAAQFAGYRELDEATLDALAEEIVEQVRLRGPFLSLAEFVNRQLSSGELALAGAVQTALNRIGSKASTSPYRVIEEVIPRESSASPVAAGDAEYQFPQAAVGHSTYGLPGWTRQADVLRPIAPVLSARDDTFTIRAYGEARDADGRVTASAVCEAVVRRTREFVDPRDEADITGLPEREINQSLGRRFQVMTFRWLSAEEI